MKKVIVGSIIAALIVAGLVAAIFYRPVVSPAADVTPEESTNIDSTNDDNVTTELSPGRYEPYSASLLAASGYDETILFFHAPWCPECRAFEQAITNGDIPKGVQMLKVDYDSSSDLKKKYGVTLQTTFVKVNTTGDRLSSWVGYGKDKSLAAVLENT